jgi:hypothetical protein
MADPLSKQSAWLMDTLSHSCHNHVTVTDEGGIIRLLVRKEA